jgi:hypothetical protein
MTPATTDDASPDARRVHGLTEMRAELIDAAGGLESLLDLLTRKLTYSRRMEAAIRRTGSVRAALAALDAEDAEVRDAHPR